MEHDLRCNDLNCRRLLASTDVNAVVTSCSRQARQHNDAVLMLMLRRNRHLLWCIANLTSILLIIVLIVSRSDLRTSAVHDSTDMSGLRQLVTGCVSASLSTSELNADGDLSCQRRYRANQPQSPSIFQNDNTRGHASVVDH